MNIKSRPYFNNHQGLYRGRQPAFYMADAVEGVALLEKSCAAILTELAENLADSEKSEICFRKKSLKRVAGWRQIELKIYGVEYPERMRLFPKTMAILDQMPGVSTIYFSILSAHSDIKPHVGDTDAFYRVHLGLKIPAGLPHCGLEVAGQQSAWQVGECIAFNDVYCHTAWNYTDEERVVLIIDILRPELRRQSVFVESGVRATLYHSRMYEIFFPVIELFPRILTRLGQPTFHLFSYLYHMLRHWLRLMRGKGEEL